MLQPLIAAILVAQTKTVTLYHGAPSEIGFRYWAVEDTFIDAYRPDVNFGRDGLLSGGKDKTILIKFGDLQRMLPGKKIVDAQLVFTIASGTEPTFTQISKVLAPWGEGPGKRGFTLPQPADPKKPGEKPKDIPPPWSATWKHRRSGPGAVSWQLAGALGDLDTAPIQEAKASSSSNTMTITGLGPTVQTMLDHPESNNGFAIEMGSNTDFASSDSPAGQPQLMVTLADTAPPAGADLAVTLIESSWKDGSAWPKDGENVNWIAHIKNVGDAPADGFSAKWIVRERASNLVDVDRKLAPGEETTTEIRLPFKAGGNDHRTEPLALTIEPKGPDSRPWNNSLEIFMNGLPVSVEIADEARASLLNQAKLNGFSSIEEFLQDRISYWNGVVAPQSRYGFAPEGSLERLRLQSIGSGSHDGLVWPINPSGKLRDDVMSLSKAIGIVDLSTLRVAPGSVTVGGQAVPRGWTDFTPGLFGGDVRDDTIVPKLLTLSEPNWFSPLSEALPMESNEMLSRTDIGSINSMVGLIGPQRFSKPFDIPGICLVRAFDASGNPLPNTDLTFYQITGGQGEAQEAFTAKTGTQGAANIPNRPGADGQKPNPYGALDPALKNGLFLVKATSHGTTEWAWLPVWRFIDEAYRGNGAAAMVDLRFNLTNSAVARDQDLALNKIVTDSEGSLPAKLAALVDGNDETDTEIGPKDGSWVEIDLGRDRPIGEVALELPVNATDSVWPAFDIYVYGTGQKATDARLYTKELNGPLALYWRRDSDSARPKVITLAYRADQVRGRFLRIMARGAKAPMRVSGIRVFAGQAD